MMHPYQNTIEKTPRLDKNLQYHVVVWANCVMLYCVCPKFGLYDGTQMKLEVSAKIEHTRSGNCLYDQITPQFCK